MIKVRTISEDGMLVMQNSYLEYDRGAADQRFEIQVDQAKVNPGLAHVALIVQFIEHDGSVSREQRLAADPDPINIDYESTDDWHG